MGGLIWFIITLFKVRNYERKIAGLYKDLELRIDEEKKRKASMDIINIRIQYLREKYRPNIEELERRRRFILDKLPFIK